jgi:hypothetical protein
MNTFAVGDVSERANVAEEMTGTLETCPTSLGIRAITFAILLGFGTIAVAGEPVRDGSCRQKSPLVVVGCCPKSLLTGCPDDYCRKPMPRFTCLPCGQPDDYCRKPLPRISSLPCGECDDYCRKPRPQTCRPFRPTYYNCGQPAH